MTQQVVQKKAKDKQQLKMEPGMRPKTAFNRQPRSNDQSNNG